jgi:hypothetical protein
MYLVILLDNVIYAGQTQIIRLRIITKFMILENPDQGQGNKLR